VLRRPGVGPIVPFSKVIYLFNLAMIMVYPSDTNPSSVESDDILCRTRYYCKGNETYVPQEFDGDGDDRSADKAGVASIGLGRTGPGRRISLGF